MKYLIMLFALAAHFAIAEEEGIKPEGIKPFTEGAKLDAIETTKGDKYTNVTIRKIEPDGISIFHQDGVKKIPFELLSDEIKAACGYSEEKAESFKKLSKASRELAYALEQEQAAQQKLKRLERSIETSIRDGAKEVWLEVYQNSGKVCLCKWGVIQKTAVMDRSGLSPKVKGYGKARGGEEEEWIAVYGLDHLADGATWEGVLYPTSNFKYTTVSGAAKTVKAFSTTVKDAAKR